MPGQAVAKGLAMGVGLSPGSSEPGAPQASGRRSEGMWQQTKGP